MGRELGKIMNLKKKKVSWWNMLEEKDKAGWIGWMDKEVMPANE